MHRYIVRRKLFPVLFLLFLSFSYVGLAINYYVSPTGSDENPGTLDSPFETISKGLTKLEPGDILYVRSGTYVESLNVNVSGTSDSYITIVAYPGENPVIDGETSLPSCDWSGLIVLWGNYIHISGFEVKNCNITGSHLSGYGVIINGHHNIVSNMNVHDAWGGGVIASGDYSVVEDCEVWNTAMSNSIDPGSDANGQGLCAARRPNNAILRYNVVHDNWGEGISTFEAFGTIVEDNIVYDNWSVNLYISDAQHVLAQRNLIYKTKNMTGGSQVGILLGDEKYNPPSSNNTIINNIVYGCNRNFMCGKLDNVLVANNTFMNSAMSSCITIYNEAHTLSSFINNIVIQDDDLPVVLGMEVNANLRRDHNLWSKEPIASAIGDGDIIGNPELSKPERIKEGEFNADDFKLQKSSPAINAGESLNDVTQDFFGNFRDASPDIGANEFIILLTSITVTGINGDTTITSEGGTLQMVANLLPDNVTNSSIEWSVENYSGSATINDNGLLSAISNGTVLVSAKAKDGSNTIGSCIVVITNQSDITDLDNQKKSRLYAIQLSDKLIIKNANTDFVADFYSLYTVQGVLIKKNRIINEPIEIDISSLSSGMFILCIFNAQHVIPLKIVIP
jgi:uncharacterized protein YjdB